MKKKIKATDFFDDFINATPSSTQGPTLTLGNYIFATVHLHADRQVIFARASWAA
jgi:hypothetical protein